MTIPGVPCDRPSPLRSRVRDPFRAEPIRRQSEVASPMRLAARQQAPPNCGRRSARFNKHPWVHRRRLRWRINASATLLATRVYARRPGFLLEPLEWIDALPPRRI